MSSTNRGSAGIPRGNEEIERPTLIYYKLDTNVIDNTG
jgi:hypothetical protein